MSGVQRGLVVLVSLAVTAGCERDGGAIRAALASRQAEWQREIQSLKAQQSALSERYVPGSSTAALRVHAAIDGVAQSIADVEAQARQISPRVEVAIGRGGEAGEKALDEESARMRDYLQALATDVASAGRQLDELGKDEQGNVAAE